MLFIFFAANFQVIDLLNAMSHFSVLPRIYFFVSLFLPTPSFYSLVIADLVAKPADDFLRRFAENLYSTWLIMAEESDHVGNLFGTEIRIFVFVEASLLVFFLLSLPDVVFCVGMCLVVLNHIDRVQASPTAWQAHYHEVEDIDDTQVPECVESLMAYIHAVTGTLLAFQ